MIDLSLILPVHNEEEIIEQVFSDTYDTLRKINMSFEIILVENGSRDSSFAVIKKLAKKFQHTRAIKTSQGYGSAVIAGSKIAKGRYLAYMPSDGQVDLTTLPKLWNILKKDTYDLVKVKRVTRENPIRYITSVTFSILMVLFFRTPFIDVNGSPKILLRKNFEKLNLQAKDSFCDAELLIKSTYLKWNIKEIPMRNIDRLGGKSTRSIHTYTEFIKNIISYRFSDDLSHWKVNSSIS